MKQNVLYIGNNLSRTRSNVSYMQTLGLLLSKEGYNMYMSSSKSNPWLRMIDMVGTTIRQRKRVDVVLIDTYSTLNFYYAFAVSQLCRLFSIPYIPILHGGNLPQRLSKSPRLSRAIFNHSKVNVAPSLFLKIVFESKGYSNVEHIPNVINMVDYTLTTREFAQPKLLWVRSFSSIYHPELAVNVLKALLDAGWNAQLCMVGPDSDGSLASVKQLAKTLDVAVIFTGKLSKQDWASLSKDYNIFINTTNFDNTPLSVIEAMALGLPIVSTNVGGLPYLIEHEHDGLLVPPNDVEAMVLAIERLFKDASLRQTLIANARRKTERFDWTAVKSKWIELLND